jgi:hypothetical protein
VFGFLRQPDVILTQALLLKFRPSGLDVLPLYIVLVLACPAIQWALLRRPGWPLLASALLYEMARKFDWNLPSFPGGTWSFNPFAWQLLFAFMRHSRAAPEYLGRRSIKQPHRGCLSVLQVVAFVDRPVG